MSIKLSKTEYYHDQKLTLTSIKDLTPYKRNSRTHSNKQVQQIVNSIKEFGFINPILVDSSNRIMAGHGRVEAAKKLDIKEVPTLRFDHLTEDQIRAYIIADNKIAENAGWDHEILSTELEYLNSVIDLDIEITGFEMAEIDLIIDDNQDETNPLDNIPGAEVDIPAIAQLGDIWQLGQHRLICGDSLQVDTYQILMEEEKASMIFTDPPYNVPVDGHVCGLGKIKHREFAMGVGEMTEDQFIGFLKTTCENLVSFSSNGSLHYLCMDWRHIYELLSAGRENYTELKNILCME